MLSSDRDGEVVAAARALGRTLAAAGDDFHDLAARIEGATVRSAARRPEPTPHAEEDWRDIVDWLFNERSDRLRERELSFVQSVADWRGYLTEKQEAWLMSIHRRLRQ
jgi:hypothetical protein